jgi:hypothetical protein
MTIHVLVIAVFSGQIILKKYSLKGTVQGDFYSVFLHIWIGLHMNMNRFGVYRPPGLYIRDGHFWCG